MKGKMKAAIFRDIEDMRVESIDIPDCPADGVLVKVHACGICGSDIRNFSNGLKDGVKNQIMGHEIAGEVVVVGADCLGFAVGDRVATAPDVSCGVCWYCRRGLVNLCENHKMLGTHFPGGYAQYMALPGQVLLHGFVEKIPAGLSYPHAAFAETAAAVVACQQRINISLGDTVVIIGDGPVGCLHVQTAKARGAGCVILIGRDRLALAEVFSPDYLLDNADPAACIEKVLTATQGRGADFVISAVPTVAVQQQGICMLRKRGTLVIYGGVPKNNEMAALNSNQIHYGEMTVTGAFSYPATGLQMALGAILTGKIEPDKYISEPVSLGEIVKAMEDVKSGKAMKAMINPWK